MRLFAAALLSIWIVASITPPLQPMPSGVGVSIAWQRGGAVADAVLAALHPPLWHNWVYDGDRMATDPTYYPTAYSLRPTAMQPYIDAAADMPGKFWILGSEPNLSQTAIAAPDAAAMVQRWQREVGGEYACCGTVQWDGYDWRGWLDAYLAASGPVPTAWHIHIYDQTPYFPVRMFREWMEARDVVRPVLVTETAAPWEDMAANAEFMTGLAQMVADGRLQAIFWYSAPSDYWFLWPSTDLMDWYATQLTPLGEHYLSLQPGGANDPTATATPEATSTPETRRMSKLFLPSTGTGGKGETYGTGNYDDHAQFYD